MQEDSHRAKRMLHTIWEKQNVTILKAIEIDKDENTCLQTFREGPERDPSDVGLSIY